jgi:predicted porin
MQKKLMAVALAGAFGAPTLALAQTSTVQIFGTMYMEYSFGVHQGASPGTATVAGPDLTNTDFLQTPGSEIGFKGEEKLGGGMSAWFQCASTADPRGQSQNGWCSRNSAVGLKGGFGNVFVGNWDTPFKRTISPTAVGGNDTGIWGTAFLLTGNSTTTTVGGNRTVWKRRQNNLISYDSPDFAGFQVMAAFTTSQPSTGTLDTASNNKPRLWSLGAQYSAGPLYVSAGYEQHREFGGASAAMPGSTHDNGWHVGAAYTWGPVRFGGLYTEQKFDTNFGDVKAKAWHAGIDWTIVGPHGLRVGYTNARDMKGSTNAALIGANGSFIAGPASGSAYRPAPGSDTGAQLWQIRYVYNFSKRTEFNAGYVHLGNDSRAAYSLGGLDTAHRNGEDQHAFAVSIRHTF